MMNYRKKPVVIQAIQLNELNREAVSKWCSDEYEDIDGMLIRTLEGNMLANFGDYIIKGVKGEFYPCKPDIFEATYELVD